VICDCKNNIKPNTFWAKSDPSLTLLVIAHPLDSTDYCTVKDKKKGWIIISGFFVGKSALFKRL